MTILDQLFNKYGSDKGSEHGNKHKYSFFYEKWFSSINQEPLKILELGLCKGGPELVDKHAGINRTTESPPSINAWLEYFPNAMLYGFDISDFSEFESDRFKFTRGDASCIDDLTNLASVIGEVDVILDDASHASYHQQFAFVNLFRSIKPGGLYIIEDLGWQPQSYEIALPSCQKTLDQFSHFINYGSFKHVPKRSLKEKTRRFLHKSNIRKDKSLEDYSQQGLEPIPDSLWTNLSSEIEFVSIYAKPPISKVVAIWKKN